MKTEGQKELHHVVGAYHFESFQAAIEFYRPMYPEYTARAVTTMLAEGAIHMGKPKLKDGERMHLHPEERRYYVVKCPEVTSNPDGSPVQTWQHLESVLSLTIYLPEGFGIGWDYEFKHDHPEGLNNVYSHTERRNHAADLLIRLGCKEYQTGIFSEIVWARFEIKDASEIDTIKQKVQSVLDRFRAQEG